MGEMGAKDVSGPALDGEGPMWEVACDAYPHRQVNRSRSWACATLRSGHGMERDLPRWQLHRPTVPYPHLLLPKVHTSTSDSHLCSQYRCSCLHHFPRSKEIVM